MLIKVNFAKDGLKSMKNILNIGIDVGSTTVKIVVMNNKKEILLTGQPYGYDIVKKEFGKDFKWEKELFSFSQPNISTWNESNSVSYNGISLGEFQVHNNRNCFKFRFNFENLFVILYHLISIL